MQLIDSIEDYWTRRSEGFSDSVNDEYANGENRLRSEILNRLDIREGSKVLDIGCGPGYFEMLLRDTGAELHAIDYSKGMVEKARSNMRDKGIEACIEQMDAQDLTFPDGVFDAVVSRNVLWNLEQPEKAYSEMLRVLKPGAKAFILDGNYYLHLFDDDYKVRREPRPAEKEEAGSHGKFNRGEVNFGEIEEISKSLPLSRQRRPLWDFNVLSNMPCSAIDVTMHPMRADDGKRRIGSFTITFTKEIARND